MSDGDVQAAPSVVPVWRLSVKEAFRASSPPSLPPELTSWDEGLDLDGVLASLPRMAAAGAQVEGNLARFVKRARELGATWAAIGSSLGMTRQSAWERFSGEE